MSEPLKTTREAVEDFGRFAKLMETAVELWRHIESIENVERRASEASSRAIVAEKREADAIERAKAAEEKFAADEERRKARASRIITEAEDQAQRLRADADGYAGRVRQAAAEDAESIRRSAEADAKAAADDAAKWRAEANALQASMAGKREELEGVERQIAEARAVITKLMGV